MVCVGYVLCYYAMYFRGILPCIQPIGRKLELADYRLLYSTKCFYNLKKILLICIINVSEINIEQSILFKKSVYTIIVLKKKKILKQYGRTKEIKTAQRYKTIITLPTNGDEE